MSEKPSCSKCDALLPVDAPAGLCPKCLVQAGFESEAAPQPSEGSSDPAVQPTLKSPAVSGGGFEPPSPEELAPLFPQLEILELLGKGGMGAVYKARQRGLDRLVAVKILPPEIGHDAAFAERFTREARALARLGHPHIVAVYDFGQTPSPPTPLPQGERGAIENSPQAARAATETPLAPPFYQPGRGAGSEGALFYIVMEYVDGVNLRQTIQTGGLTPQNALAIVPQICEALQFAHDEGIVHRDIKPENILIDKKGRVKIADFGLAKLTGQDPREHFLTGTHQVMGTLRYMAPEQMQGSREVDHRADIYSLGVVFYELLTGELPMGKFAPPSKKVQVDVRLDEIVLRALEQEPEQRYQHASEVKTDVDAVVRSAPASPSSANRIIPPTLGTVLGALPDHSKDAPAERRLVQAPADCLLLAAGIALVTAFGVVAWLGVKASSGDQLNSTMTRGNLIGMSITLAIYAIFIGVAGLMMRQLRARLFVLLVDVIVGLFLPAVIALNVVMEIRSIPEWRVVIPLWLGMPAALWAVVALFRDAVCCAFDTAAKQRRILARNERPQQTPGVAGEPRFSRFAIVGAVWAVFGLLAVIPALYFIALARVWNGTALPTDLVHEQPPLAFTIFMGALLAIGSGAPIGTTVFGAISLRHIQRSGGKLVGLPLAVTNALFFPLLLLDFLITAIVAGIVMAILFAAYPHGPRGNLSFFLPQLLTLIFALPLAVWIDFLIVRSAWRNVAGRSNQPSHVESWPWRIAIFCSLLFFCTTLFVINWLSTPFAELAATGQVQSTIERTESNAMGLPAPESSTGWIMGPGGPVLTDAFAQWVLKIRPDQVSLVNAVLQDAHRDYFALELQNNTCETSAAGHVITTITPFPGPLAKLEDHLWSRFDAILDSEQQSVARLNLLLHAKPVQPPIALNEIVAPGFFGWGEHPVRVELWRVGAWYHWKVDARGYTDSSRAPQLPEPYRRFWKEPAADDARIQGTWTYVANLRDGQFTDPGDLKQWRVTFMQGEYTEQPGYRFEKGTYKLDPTKSPKTIDCLLTEGPYKGLPVAGIYEWDGDILKICWAHWGSLEHPQEFSATPGSQRALVILNREKAATLPEE